MLIIRNSIYVSILIYLTCAVSVKSEPLIHQVELPSGRHGQVVSYNADYVICKTEEGKEAANWLDVDLLLSFCLETNRYLKFDQQVITNKGEKVTRTLISIKSKGDKWRCYLTDRYDERRVDPVTKKPPKRKREFISHFGSAYFIGKDTLIVAPEHHFLAFRDYNHDGELEEFRANKSYGYERISQKVVNSFSTWYCSFLAWDNGYWFNVETEGYPLPPEPHPKEGWIFWDNKEYLLEELLLEDSTGHLRYPVTTGKIEANQSLPPTAKTPAESGSTQGTAGLL